MSIQELSKHPELLNKETLFELRRIVADYPYYQPARLLMLKNLYILHDPSFDDELRMAAIYFTDRRILFNLVEQAHYRLKRKTAGSFKVASGKRQHIESGDDSRTVSLIDTFLSTMPEDTELSTKKSDKSQRHRKPTAADATVDYVAYLLSTDFEELESKDAESNAGDANGKEVMPTMNGGDLIDRFINNDGGKITLQETPEYAPEVEIADNSDHDPEDDYLTETLAGIYIKQGRFEKALDIMNRLDKQAKKKNPYFEDQKRFLEKVIANKSK